MSRALPAIVAASVLGLCACVGFDDDDDDGELGEVEQELTTTNGVNLNGVNLNGIGLNGVNLNGINFSEAKLDGITVTGATVGVNGLSVVKNGVTLFGAGIVGTKLVGTLSNGGTVKIRIDGAALLPSGVWGYHVVASVDGVAVGAICPGPNQAIAIPGRWDYRADVAGAGGPIADAGAFTFACRNYALAKCVEWGYAPWKTVAGVQLANHHAACVRMVRGDYCGDGHAWTQDGTPINVYDTLGIQADTTAWRVDAEWTATGAKCLDKARVFTTPSACLKALRDKDTCGSFGLGVLLIDEYKPL